MSGNRDASWQIGGLARSVARRLGPGQVASSWRGDAHAVIIGIDAYQDQRIPDLRFARKDAEAVYRVLTDPAVGRFNPANVTLLVDGDATERRIRSALGTRLPQRTSRTSTVCIYYAGHGAPVVDLDPRRRSADNIEKYLVPHDAVADDLRATAISMDSVQQYFSWLDANQVICFLDSCYSGAAGGRSFERDSFQIRALVSDDFLDGLAGEGRVVMTACAASEVSLESPDKGHGLFTYYLVQGLRGEADADGDGRITVDELYNYVYQHVERDARLMHGRMNPIQKGSVRGRVYLTEYRESRATPVENGPTTDSAPEAAVPQAPNARWNNVLTDESPTGGDRRRWLTTILVGLTAAFVVAGWLWISSASRSGDDRSNIPPPPVSATGQVALEWSGSTGVQWSVVDANDKTIEEGLAAAKSTSRIAVPKGDFFVLFRGLPEVRRLPVRVLAGETSTVTPAIGQLEVRWNGANPTSANVMDERGSMLRENWSIPPKGTRVADLGPGRYSVVLPNSKPRPVTVLAGSTSTLNLEPGEPPGTSPGPRPPVMPYVPGQWKLPSTDLLGFIEIPAGIFTMGSDRSQDKSALQDELPQHQVNLPAFLIGRYEVTVDQYKACVDDGVCKPGDANVLRGAGVLPVRHVSWLEAVQYCDWLDVKLRSWSGTPGQLATALSGARGGRPWQVRLPTEAEWEKAARGADGRTYPWGERVDSTRANYADAKLSEPAQVGRYPNGASAYGLLDMSGNVWEWTRSRYLRYPYRQNDGREEVRPGKHEARVIRGGSFQTADVRAARRNWGDDGERTDFTGFRVAVASPITSP